VNAISETHGHRVFRYGQDEPTLRGEQDAVDLIGAAFGDEVTVVVVPADRVAPDFYVLSTRVAGEVLHKFTMYGIRLVVLGDITGHLAASESFRAFVHEANRGRNVWFVPGEAELAAKLAG
jgi:uncharacterized protein DUF4180